MIVATLGSVYARRHKAYKAFMEGIQSSIIAIQKTEDIERKKMIKAENPF